MWAKEVGVGTLNFLKDRVLSAPPAKVLPTNLDTWLAFADGACEGLSTKMGSVGAVLIDSNGNACEFFRSNFQLHGWDC